MIAWLLFGLAAPPAAAGLTGCLYRLRTQRQDWDFIRHWMITGAGGLPPLTLALAYGMGLGEPAGWSISFLAAVAAWLWRRRRDRKRAASLLGEKSRALIAALVARVRESAAPRPVLKPVPGGAR